MGSVRSRQDNGLLFFDFRVAGRRCREQTLLPDTPVNRKKLEKVLARIEADVEAGTFDYASTFPASRAAAAVRQGAREPSPDGASSVGTTAAGTATPTFREFTSQWLAEHQVEWRRSHLKVLKSTLDGHLLPAFGGHAVGTITKTDILAFRARLADLPGRTHDKLSHKRINGILAPLKQIMNDAADRHGFVSPCTTLKRLKVRRTDVEPFTLDEVERLLATVSRPAQGLPGAVAGRQLPVWMRTPARRRHAFVRL